MSLCVFPLLHVSSLSMCLPVTTCVFPVNVSFRYYLCLPSVSMSLCLMSIQVGTAGGLLWEAVSVLNGAHLSPSGRLGNLVRQYHKAVSSTSAEGETPNKQVDWILKPCQHKYICPPPPPPLRMLKFLNHVN